MNKIYESEKQWTTLESYSNQLIVSLVNIEQRLPILMNTQEENWDNLDLFPDLPKLLVQKHIQSCENLLVEVRKNLTTFEQLKTLILSLSDQLDSLTEMISEDVDIDSVCWLTNISTNFLTISQCLLHTSQMSKKIVASYFSKEELITKITKIGHSETEKDWKKLSKICDKWVSLSYK
ncbi:hypothetical protein M0813_20403 [Anaeramoeba flamelloides]|uniref:Uncharacterized protein n=1 Tax=Anaeramoeba flamelloides TaxID=1746091 RepID=A0ABQ8YLI1_9EUKA|nr:hypothetical protein M0813_20403 [Anaeramoeba flamelloides]